MNNARHRGSRLGATILLGALLASSAAAAKHFTILYSFTGPRNGDAAYPMASVIADSAGALYGTTPSGGTAGFGAVYKLTPPQDGNTHWTESVLYSFKGGNDASTPEGGLVFDANGALYGTSASGGGARRCQGGGCGTIFKLTPPAQGLTQWTETLLHRFSNKGDSAVPSAGLIFDSAGALYGTTLYNVAFRLSPPKGGKGPWAFAVIYAFGSQRNDGSVLQCDLVPDKAGALYGTTYEGGTHNTGTVFQLVPNGKGAWSESVLHSFTGSSSGASRDGAYPIGRVMFDATGALYGTTFNAGRFAGGTIFKLTPPNRGQTKWTESLAYSFGHTLHDGADPSAGLTADSSGALYGTTENGGGLNPNNFGTVFRLTTSGIENVVHSFKGLPDGAQPYAALTAGPNGVFYGTTQFQGPQHSGTVFEVTP